MENRFFSLILVPDNSNDIKTGSFNLKLVFYLFFSLVSVFLICLSIIIGYHIKLNQEKDYINTVTTMRALQTRIDKSKNKIATLSKRLLKIQRNDLAYRQFAYMDVLDGDMYKAGIGGHALVDEALFSGLSGKLPAEVKDISITIMKIENRVKVQNTSLREIQTRIQRNIEEANATPSILPTHSYRRINSGFGFRYDPINGRGCFHDAVDLGGHRGDPIFATADGTVISAQHEGALGWCIHVKHKYGHETLYGHLDAMLVRIGQDVTKGQLIGKMGRSGRATGVHLHYAVSLFGKKVNPRKYF